jgi:hypothetical protein
MLAKPNQSARRAAYSVVEVMVAVGVAGLTMVSVLSGFSVTFGILQTARENLRATQVLQEKMETIRLYSWDQINTPGFVPDTFTASSNPTNQTIGMIYSGTMTITNAPLTEVYNTNLVEIIAQLTWTSGNIQRHRKMTTFVSRYGLQNYVY